MNNEIGSDEFASFKVKKPEQPSNFLESLTDEQRWGEEQIPLIPENITATEVNHETHNYVFVAKSSIDARTLGQSIAIGTMYNDLRAFGSEGFLASEFPIEDYRLDGAQLSYHETPLDTGEVQVRVFRRYSGDKPTEIELNTQRTIDEIVAKVNPKE